MATFEKRISHGHSVVYVKIRLKGHPPQSATLPTMAAARKWARVTEAAIVEGRYLPQTPTPQYTLGDLIGRYLVEVLPGKRPATIPTQRLQLSWWCQELGQYPVAEITPARLVECRDRLASGRSNATTNRYLAVLSHLFTVAVREWQLVTENPVSKIRKPREPRGRVRFLSDEERQHLLDACRESRNKDLYLVVILALSTGARRGELLGLRWADVDTNRGLLTFRETKNGESRAVPLTGQALSLMRERSRGSGGPLTALVFPPTAIRTAWDNAVRRAGLVDFRFHDLRHSSASYLAMSGASMVEIAEVLGHKTLSMVKRYSHLSEAHTRGVVERMNRAVFGGVDLPL